MPDDHGILPRSYTRFFALVGGAFLALWVLFGIAGFVMSFVCFGYSGTLLEKLFGIILAVFLGPIYWVYYYASSSYCKSLPPAFF